MTRLLPAIIACTLLTSSGCVLPFPHFKQTCGRIEGTVLDAGTLQPVNSADITVVYPDGGERETQTDDDGYFSLPPKFRFHWGVVIGIALNYSLPYDMGWFDFKRVYIDHKGYQPVWFRPPDGIYPDEPADLDKGNYQQIQPLVGEAKGTSDPMGSHRNWRFPRICIDRRDTASQPAQAGGLRSVRTGPGRDKR